MGEVVFNTSLTGYQEILTDPSYRGQFVCFTYPHIGNVGINPEDMESEQVHLGAAIIRDLSSAVSNYRSTQTLDAYLKAQGVLGIADVDTRAITRRLRVTGCLNGVITTDMTTPDAELVAQTKAWSIVGKDLISEVTCSKPYEWRDPTGKEWEFAPEALAAREGGAPFHVVAYDFGIKHNIMRRLASYGCRITVVPADFPAAEVLKMNPDGVFFSNGPVSTAVGEMGGWGEIWAGPNPPPAALRPDQARSRGVGPLENTPPHPPTHTYGCTSCSPLAFFCSTKPVYP